MKRLWADFNEVYDADYVWTSLGQTRGFVPGMDHVEPGDWVELEDDDSVVCSALVTRMSGQIIHCKIDWSTWKQVTVAELPGWTTDPRGWMETTDSGSTWGPDAPIENQPIEPWAIPTSGRF